MNDFDGRHAVITGGAKGIGAATGLVLASRGARVTALDVDAASGEALAAATERIEFVRCDVTEPEAVARSVGDADLLVNSAGIAPPMTVPAIDASEWRRVLSVNVEGTWNAIRAVLDTMRARRRGAIVNVSSVAGKNISMGAGVNYTASKWSLIGMTRHLAYELAPDGIRVNAVCPGPTLTSFVSQDPEFQHRAAEAVPLGRWVVAEDIAKSIAFLLSDDAAMVTGADLVVDGGALLGSGHAYPGYFEARGGTAPARDITYPNRTT